MRARRWILRWQRLLDRLPAFMRAKNKKIRLRKSPQKVREVFVEKTREENGEGYKKTSRTEDANHYVVRRVVSRGGKRLFFRVDKRGVEHTIRTYVIQKIFSELYPQNSIAPVGVGTIVVGGKMLTGMFSRIIPKRSRSYVEFQKKFYGEGTELETHSQFTRRKGMPLAAKIVLESGFRVNDKPVNVAESNGKPIFFEVAWVDPAYFRLFLEIKRIDPIEIRKLFADAPKNQQATIQRVLDQLLVDKPRRIEVDAVPHRPGDMK